MGIKFSNNASANIIQALTSTATSVSITPGKGDLFPSITEGDYFYATLAGNKGLEIVKVTNRVNDTMTIVRAQDNTMALSFDTGDLFELRIVAADFNDTFSEVNDKLENSIEEITSNVNSALASKAPILHSSSSTEYGAGSSDKYGHLKSHDIPDVTKTAATGNAFSPAGAAVMQETLEGQISDLASTVRSNAYAQSTKDAEQDSEINSKVSTVNGLIPDSNGNVNVGGMPLGTLIPYTGKDVPAGTLRADGTTYTNMRASFPEFYAWVVESGITVLLSDYTLIEGSCGYYGLDESTGTVRMPTLAAGVFGTSVASQYGQAIEAGLPNINATSSPSTSSMASSLTSYSAGAVYYTVGGTYSRGTAEATQNLYYYSNFDASRSSPVYGRSDTVTPSHVKYPWVVVVYNAAVPSSVAQAGEFVGLLDGKADKTQLGTFIPTGTVIAFAANKAPDGFLLCNGAAVSRTIYADLFAAIGTTYTSSSNSSTFNLPDLTDRFIQGSGTAGTHKEAGLPNITGRFHDYRSYLGIGSEQGVDGVFLGSTTSSSGGASYSSNGTQSTIHFSANKSNTIYGKSTTVQPLSLTMRYYIKY